MIQERVPCHECLLHLIVVLESECTGILVSKWAFKDIVRDMHITSTCIMSGKLHPSTPEGIVCNDNWPIAVETYEDIMVYRDEVIILIGSCAFIHRNG